jgi:hypothetical protein
MTMKSAWESCITHGDRFVYSTYYLQYMTNFIEKLMEEAQDLFEHLQRACRCGTVLGYRAGTRQQKRSAVSDGPYPCLR